MSARADRSQRGLLLLIIGALLPLLAAMLRDCRGRPREIEDSLDVSLEESRDDSLDDSQDESPDDSLVYSLHPWVAIFLLSDLFRCERGEGVIAFLRWLVAPTISAVGRRNER